MKTKKPVSEVFIVERALDQEFSETYQLYGLKYDYKNGHHILKTSSMCQGL